MSVSLQRLLPLFERERELARAMVLATVVRTAGPTYTKPGTQLLVAASGEYAGLISGGCLEGDLGEHSRSVLASGAPKVVSYDMRGPDDLLFGMGSGCEGAMDILLQRIDAAHDWQPMQRLSAAWRAQRAEALLLVVNSTDPQIPAGAGVFAGDGASFGLDEAPLALLRRMGAELAREGSSRFLPHLLPGVDALALRQPPPPRVLLLGAGPDAQPVAQLAAFLGWHLTVVDHRSHYAQAARFPGAAATLDGGPQAAANLLAAAQPLTPGGPAPFAAAIIMSHHLAHDLAYLRVLAHSTIPYVGLLGPPARRERLLASLGADAGSLRERLRAPIGLDLGAATPEAIALSIIAEIHATLAQDATMGPMSRKSA